MSLEDMRRELEEKYERIQGEVLCLPKIPCVRSTPYGLIEGLQCEMGPEVNHNTTIEALPKIIEYGAVITGAKKWVLGQDALSLSPCPSQHFGGNIKLIFESDRISDKLRAVCYYKNDDPPENEVADRGMDNEASESYDGIMKGSNRVRANYAVSPWIYEEECEYVSQESIPLKGNLKRIEYWVPWKVGGYDYSLRCRGSHPGYSFTDFGDSVKLLIGDIKRVKESAEKAGVPFKVKSCFSTLKTGWGDQYILLTDENLELFSRGEVPKVVYGKIPEKCRC